MPHRFETDFGDDGMKPGADPRQGNLQAFGALYRFDGRTWGITVWAKGWPEAGEYCRAHGLKLDGQIVATYEA